MMTTIIPNKLEKKILNNNFCISYTTFDAVSSAFRPSIPYYYYIIRRNVYCYHNNEKGENQKGNFPYCQQFLDTRNH